MGKRRSLVMDLSEQDPAIVASSPPKNRNIRKEHHTHTSNILAVLDSNPPPLVFEGQGFENTNVIRYQREELLALRYSEACKRPERLAQTQVWFGELPSRRERGHEESPGERRGDKDKGIVLGPPKSSFASLLGVKKGEEDLVEKSPGDKEEDKSFASATNSLPLSARLNGRGYQTSTDRSDTKLSSRLAKMPGSSVRGERSGERLDKMGAFGTTSRISPVSDPRLDKRRTRDGPGVGREQRQRMGRFEREEKQPEWLDYNPETEEMATTDDAISSEKVDDGAGFMSNSTNQLEQWKSQMKDQERRKKQGVPEEAARSMRADESTSWRATTSPQESKASRKDDPIFGGIDMGPTMLDPLYSQNYADETSQSTQESIPSGSRFARFFNKSHTQETTDIASAQMPPPQRPPMLDEGGRSISLDVLFQAQTLSPSQQSHQMPHPHYTSPNIPSQPRMLSEQDILNTLAKLPTSPRKPDNTTKEEDQAGFNMIMQALSRAKPQVPPTTSSPMASRQYAGPPSELNDPAIASASSHIPAKSPPAIGPTNQAQRSPTPMQASEEGTPKSRPALNQHFMGNMPTSVLRQLSGKASGDIGSRTSSNNSSPRVNNTTSLPSSQPTSYPSNTPSSQQFTYGSRLSSAYAPPPMGNFASDQPSEGPTSPYGFQSPPNQGVGPGMLPMSGYPPYPPFDHRFGAPPPHLMNMMRPNMPMDPNRPPGPFMYPPMPNMGMPQPPRGYPPMNMMPPPMDMMTGMYRPDMREDKPPQ
ncbi:hypothetical protein BZG36_02489 [Bifiguratus adelaidae]|uniref:Uncharacterized protein n=1 Tax=Bifiguratus adelaidae TaxID=1938954 RepID=A0A261Y0Y5_9FUNG|nr:hypothetical protein BZG36_02489 [Bifiguratus adelaidae]